MKLTNKTIKTLITGGTGTLFGIALVLVTNMFGNNSADKQNIKTIKEDIASKLLVEKQHEKAQDFAEAILMTIKDNTYGNLNIRKIGVLDDMVDDSIKVKQDETIYLQKGKLIEFNEDRDTVTLSSFDPEPVKALIRVIQNNTLD